MGIDLSPKAESNQNSNLTRTVEHLGLYWTFGTEDDENEIVIQVPEKKLKESKERCNTAIENLRLKAIKYKEVAKVTGDTNYIICSKEDRAGANLLRPVYPFLVEENFLRLIKNRSERRQLNITLHDMIYLIDSSKPMKRSLKKANRKTVWLYTDASSNGSVNGKPKIAAVLINEVGEIFTTEAEVSSDLDLSIDFYEAYAVWTAIKTFKHMLKDKLVMAGIDNVVDAYCFIKASHRNPIVAKAITESIKEARENDTSIFYDYVITENNIADWLTREDLRFIMKLLKPKENLKPILPKLKFKDKVIVKETEDLMPKQA